MVPDNASPQEHIIVSNPSDSLQAQVERRAALKAALGGAAAAAVLAGPTISSFSVAPPYAAAASGTATSVMRKAGSGNQPPLAPCTFGPDARTGQTRGTAAFARTENPAQICATITLSTGQPTTSRTIRFYHSADGTCIGTTEAGSWPDGELGPLTYCSPILAGATTFVVNQVASGGNGNDDSISEPVTLT
jgi:hypothetical protein